MLEQVKLALSELKNPQTGKSFDEENRWQHVKIEGDKLIIQYARDGISPENKRLIENEIQQMLSKIIINDQILIKTTSQNSQDVYKSLENKLSSSSQTKETSSGQAQIKVGHGTVGNKKKVSGVNKIIAVGSGKGGVGKSTITANLGLALSKLGYSIGIIDADIYGPSMPMIFGKREEKPRSNSDRKIIPIDSHGIKFMSFGFFINEADPVIWRGPMLGGVLNQFLFDVDWGNLDFLIIDLPPGTGDIQLSMIQNTHVDGAIIVSTPQDIALLDARKGLEMFKKLQLPIIGMVENMSSFICQKCGHEHFLFGQAGVERTVKDLELNLLGKIPLEIELRMGSDSGEPYMAEEKFSERPVWKAFMDIAQNVGKFLDPHPEKSRGAFFYKILGIQK